MLRYLIAVADHDAPDLDPLVARGMGGAEDWQIVFSSVGVRVACCALRHSSEVHLLAHDAGVVLGPLFVRPAESEDVVVPVAPDIDEGRSKCIVETCGERLFRDYWGTYVAVIHDQAGRTHILRDPSAGLPCFRIRVAGAWLFVASMREGRRFLDAPPRIDYRYVAAWLAGTACTRATALTGVEQLLGGECETLSRGARPQRRIYWNPLIVGCAEPIADRERARTSLRAAVRTAVRTYAQYYGQVTHALSGGVDSSIVAVCLRDCVPRATAFHHYVEGSLSDERPFAEAAARAAGLPLQTEPRPARADLRGITSVQPIALFFNVVDMVDLEDWTIQWTRAVGASAQFNGVGGDSVFFHVRPREAVAHHLQQYRVQPHLFRVALDAARIEGSTVWEVLTYGVKAQRHRWAPDQEIVPWATLLTGAALADIRQQFCPPWLDDSIGASSATRCHAGSLNVGFPVYPLFSTDADVPDAVLPLMSQIVQEVCLRIEPRFHIEAGWNRAVARQAFSAELPEVVYKRRSKGAYEVPAARAAPENQRFIREFLLDGCLVAEGVVDAHAVEHALAPQQWLNEQKYMGLTNVLSAEAILGAWRQWSNSSNLRY